MYWEEATEKKPGELTPRDTAGEINYNYFCCMSTHRTGLGLNLLSLQQLRSGPELPESHFH